MYVNRELGSRNYVVEIKDDVIEKACAMQGGNKNYLKNSGHEETTYGSKHILENTIKIYLREMG
jgi:hypothetical protein